jgi:uncharacterized protein YjiS (DUF1127 family)
MQHVIAHRGLHPRASSTGVLRQIGQWVAHVRTAMTVARERRQLMQLDDRMLRDIGIGRSEAYAEASRSFGDLPIR